jgi:outer membrane protein OmpA-like peptidoglycan-associated protein
MKANFKTTIALAGLLAGASGAAYATEGWYGRVDAGYSFDGTQEFDILGDADFENDWVEGLGLGYAFSGGLRLEGEISHRFNALDTSVATDGDTHAWAAMLNGYYDFNADGAISPYVGLGVGAARVNGNGSVGPLAYDDQDTAFAYQGAVGVAFAVSDQLSLDVGYRYFTAPELSFTSNVGDFESGYEHHAALVGLRWQFAGAAPPPPPPPPPVVEAPPPPPPPPPAPVACPTAEFVVYFEWDRSNLNQTALDTIDAALAQARACNLSAVTVVGHTDTSGSADYNAGLSERRASVVRDAIVARGLPAAAITTQARGETDLARATRDGVREPLNRRAAVTITFQ